MGCVIGFTNLTSPAASSRGGEDDGTVVKARLGPVPPVADSVSNRSACEAARFLRRQPVFPPPGPFHTGAKAQWGPLATADNVPACLRHLRRPNRCMDAAAAKRFPRGGGAWEPVGGRTGRGRPAGTLWAWTRRPCAAPPRVAHPRTARAGQTLGSTHPPTATAVLARMSAGSAPSRQSPRGPNGRGGCVTLRPAVVSWPPSPRREATGSAPRRCGARPSAPAPGQTIEWSGG